MSTTCLSIIEALLSCYTYILIKKVLYNILELLVKIILTVAEQELAAAILNVNMLHETA